MGTAVMGAYLAEAALEELVKAQAELERHLLSRPGGRCLACGGMEPCRARVRLEAVFALYGRLPKRRPGATVAGVRVTEHGDNRPWFEG
jgi:hypothetical protein